jgi:hypothetical protein
MCIIVGRVQWRCPGLQIGTEPHCKPVQHSLRMRIIVGDDGVGGLELRRRGTAEPAAVMRATECLNLSESQILRAVRLLGGHCPVVLPTTATLGLTRLMELRPSGPVYSAGLACGIGGLSECCPSRCACLLWCSVGLACNLAALGLVTVGESGSGW